MRYGTVHICQFRNIIFKKKTQTNRNLIFQNKHISNFKKYVCFLYIFMCFFTKKWQFNISKINISICQHLKFQQQHTCFCFLFSNSRKTYGGTAIMNFKMLNFTIPKYNIIQFQNSILNTHQHVKIQKTDAKLIQTRL